MRGLKDSAGRRRRCSGEEAYFVKIYAAAWEADGDGYGKTTPADCALKVWVDMQRRFSEICNAKMAVKRWRGRSERVNDIP